MMITEFINFFMQKECLKSLMGQRSGKRALNFLPLDNNHKDIIV